MRRFFTMVSLAGAVFLCGCQPQVIKVPIYACPQSVIPSEPDYKNKYLRPDDSASTIVKAWAMSFEQARGYAEELRILLEGYNAGISKE